MQTVQSTQSGNSRLRFVFDDTVMSFNLAAPPTLGEIARRYDNLSLRRHGNPRAINVAMSRCGGPFKKSLGQIE